MKSLITALIMLLSLNCTTQPLKVDPNPLINNMVVLDLSLIRDRKPKFNEITSIICKSLDDDRPSITLTRKGKYLYAFNVQPGRYIVNYGEFKRDYPSKKRTQSVRIGYVFYDDTTLLTSFTVTNDNLIYVGSFRVTTNKPKQSRFRPFGGDISFTEFCYLDSYDNSILTQKEVITEVKEIYSKTEWASLINKFINQMNSN